jgi:tetratricopeptide (TPR) repeat protein
MPSTTLDQTIAGIKNQFRLGHYREAFTECEQAYKAFPLDGSLRILCAKMYALIQDHQAAIAHLEQARSLDSSNPEIFFNLGICYREQLNFEQASQSFAAYTKILPRDYDGWFSLAESLCKAEKYQDSIDASQKAIDLNPSIADCWSNLAVTYKAAGKNHLALQAYEKAFSLEPASPFLIGKLLHQKMLCADWSETKSLAGSIKEAILSDQPAAEPFGYQGISDSEEDLKRCAQIYASKIYPSHLQAVGQASEKSPRKIKIAYLCGEFREHATSLLLCGVFESHNKDEFETYALDNGWDDGSKTRQRLNNCFDHIYDIKNLSDKQAIELIRTLEIDILVNLNGYFGAERQNIFSYHSAPIQVSYLGFPGTLGVDYMDYLIADSTVIPEGSQKFYCEKIAYLPNSYQANDSRREIATHSFTRADFDLPQNGFVFCCFNNTYKITPEVFSSWMNILEKTPNSVLWLLEDNELVSENLKKVALNHKIDSDRLIFAKRISAADHLARHSLADLFLDTVPYNAHTTASDALWAGLPVLTLKGNTFPGRVGASLLQAINLSDLVTHNQSEYEALAVKFANKPELLAHYKKRLQENRLTTPLFNTVLYTQKLEAAFKEMWQQFSDGKEPTSIFIK